MEKVAPKDNFYLIGQEDAEQLFLQAFNEQTLHHAFLLTGQEGIGKATFAYKIARFLLTTQEENKPYKTLDISTSNPIFAQISNGSNPDFKVIERDFIENDKKKIIKAIKDGKPLDEEELEDLKKSSVIKVEDIRQINDFLNKTSFDNKWRIVLIDSVDDLNAASANALLKILEEPPAKSLLLLISNHVERLLPTIRSRCVKLTLKPLSEKNIQTLLRRYMPELSENEVNQLSKLSHGSIGKALNYASHDGANMFQKLQSVCLQGKNFDLKTALDIATLASSDEDVWDLVFSLILQLVFDISESFEKTEQFCELYHNIILLKNEAESLNMDKKQVLMNIFYAISKVTQNDY